jgi:hypothetical protein
MSQLLKIAGGLALLNFLLGSRVSGAIFDRIEYDLAGIRRQDVRMDVRNGRVVALVNLRLFLKQMFGITLSVTGVDLAFTQQGNNLGIIRANRYITLPHARATEVPLLLMVPAGNFLDHLQTLLSGGAATALAPINIAGSIYLSNGVTVPVRLTLNFLSFA